MNKQEVLDFLRRHQPMPPDSELTEELLIQYDEARKFCIENPDPECIPLFLNSFGEGSGFGVYQLVENMLDQYPKEMVIPHLKEALESSKSSVRSWCVEIAALYPTAELIEPLGKLLIGDEDPDTRIWSAISLGLINSPRAKVILEQALAVENNPRVLVEIKDALSKKK